jgi:hypothetical protein
MSTLNCTTFPVPAFGIIVLFLAGPADKTLILEAACHRVNIGRLLFA